MNNTKKILAGLISLSCVCASGQTNKPVYLDEQQPIELRVKDALSRMTLEEKTRLSYAQGKFSSPGCPRLGIPELWMSDGPHGVRGEIHWNEWGYAGWTNDSCTAFPALTCLAASWNQELAGKYGKAIGEEALYRKKDVLLGPGVNIYRTPLNGRNFEYLGEDPYLAAEMCVPYIKGVQENGVAACVKHFALNNQELWRGHIDVQVSERALREIYLPAFRAAVEKGHVWSIMGAYNKVRGTHATHHEMLNNKILKGEWNFDGCVISDWGATHDTYEAAMYGLDIEMGSYTDGLVAESEFGYDDYYLGKKYRKMIKEGKIPMEVVDEKAARVLRLIFRTSMNRQRGFGAMNSEEHENVAYEIATEGIVLLKNDKATNKKQLLPVNAEQCNKILIVGDNATRNLTQGGGSSELKAKKVISPLDAFRKRFKDKIIYSQGYTAGENTYGEHSKILQVTADSLRNDAVQKAKDADIVIFIGGLNKNYQQDSEGGDRISYGLPYGQNELIDELYKVNKNVVVVIVSGNAVEMPWVNRVPSIVQSWYLGSIGGEALADVLTGKVTPSGKLPFSYPKKLEDCPAHYYGNMSYPGDSISQEYKEDIFVGYRWYDTKKVEPLFPFGYGMSYTSFDYGKLQASRKSISENDTLQISLTVKNSGRVDGKEIVQLYIGDEKCSVLRPVKELKEFAKVELKAGEEKQISFYIDADDLKFYDDKRNEWVVESGKFKAYVGASSADIRGVVEFEYK